MLIIEVNWLGDVLFSTPAIRAVRRANPDGYIACLVHPRGVEILEGNTAVDEIIIYDEEGIHRGIIGKIRLIFSLRRKRFDTVYIFHRSFTKALIAYLSGARQRIGYPTKNRGWLLTLPIEEPDAGAHKVEYFLKLTGQATGGAKDVAYEFLINDSDRARAKAILSGHRIAESDKIVSLCPGGNWDPKRWPKENFARLSDMLIERCGVKVVITGGPKERELALEICGLMKNPAAVTCGQTSLKELGAIFEKSALVVANDTGSMHIAVATGAKVIALFGPTSSELTGPYGKGSYKVMKASVECDIPCYDMTCGDNRCMRSISVDDVFGEASGMLRNERTGR